MQYRKQFKSHKETEERYALKYHEHLSMLIETLQFVIQKVGELSQWQQEEERRRRKSMLKVFDKNIDSIHPVKMEIIDPPVFD